MIDLKTCRFCGFSNFEHNHPNANSAWIKYAPRCNAHLKCLVGRKGERALRMLPDCILKSLPFLELTDLGLLDYVHQELARREAVRAEHAVDSTGNNSSPDGTSST